MLIWLRGLRLGKRKLLTRRRSVGSRELGLSSGTDRDGTGDRDICVVGRYQNMWLLEVGRITKGTEPFWAGRLVGDCNSLGRDDGDLRIFLIVIPIIEKIPSDHRKDPNTKIQTQPLIEKPQASKTLGGAIKGKLSCVDINQFGC